MAVGRRTFTKAERQKLAEVLWLLNWVSVLTGALLFGLGLFLRVEIQKWQEVMSGPGILYVPHVLISTGWRPVASTSWGEDLPGLRRPNRFLRWKLVLMPYVVCSLCFTACVLGGALLCYGVQSQLEDSLLLGLQNAMRFYKDTDTPGRCYLKKTVDLLQIQFQCCGNAGYRDWFQVQWISNRYLDMTSSSGRLRSNVGGQFLQDSVPFSCCSPSSPRPCIQTQLRDASQTFNWDQLNQWGGGCRRVLVDHYRGLLQTIGFTVLLIWLFEVLLLGTTWYYSSVIKNLGKCYHGDQDPNLNTPPSRRSSQHRMPAGP
ncbi:hypothetical protein F7725_020079 [Dissostichus mawsoni]|uniref:Uncharacterized protein n=1 Tax=Dissostichus mawsoni TaxID=36200 RepID=A0A7J5YLW6_DISMA|nr:hypothetical protein F7725_020079 [Dissostichus mawsoni]